MTIFKMELFKIYSKKIIYFGLIGSLLFLAFYFWMSVLGSEYMYIDGKCYTRTAAIRENIKIAQEYAGPLTTEKVQDIIKRFGYTIEADQMDVDVKTGNTEQGYYENSINRYITENLTTKRFDREEKIRLVTEQDSPNIAKLMDGSHTFGYTDGWGNDFREMQMMVMVITSVLIIIAAAPVFSDEYALHTADILLITVHGRRKSAVSKILAALCFSSILYLAVTALVFSAFAAAYGISGFSVSADLVFPDLAFSKTNYGTVGDVLLQYVVTGLIASWVTTCITLYFSARHKQSFAALIWGLLMYLLPLIIYSIILSPLRPTRFIMLCSMIVKWFPIYLPANILTGGMPIERFLSYGCSFLLVLGGSIFGVRKYMRYQAG